MCRETNNWRRMQNRMIDKSTIKIRDHFWMMVVVYLSTQSIAFIDMKLIVWSSVKLKSVSKNLLSFFFTTLFDSPQANLMRIPNLDSTSNQVSSITNTILGSKDQNQARFLTSNFLQFRMSVWKEIHCSCYKFSSIKIDRLSWQFF